jgi:hypothetical protein
VNRREQSPEKLIDHYVRAAERHALGDDVSNVAEANAAADEIAAIHQELRSRPDNVGVRLLLPLLEHSTPNVRLWAAAHTLHVSPNEAVSVLEALARTRGFIGISAATTLAEWRAGRLRLP